jgi:hypothetical protein
VGCYDTPGDVCIRIYISNFGLLKYIRRVGTCASYIAWENNDIGRGKNGLTDESSHRVIADLIIAVIN